MKKKQLVYGLVALAGLGAGGWAVKSLLLNTPTSAVSANTPRVSFTEEIADKKIARCEIDQKRVMEYLEKLCAIGPRISGTTEMTKQQELLKEHFEKLGATVTFQEFEAKQPSRDQACKMKNMIVSWNPEAKKRFILCGHYDTRPIADMEQNVRNWTKPFVSANDGTSTVALYMELAHHMKNFKFELGVDFIFFDGEEYIFDRDRDKFFKGSEHFAAEYKKSPPKHEYVAGILLDLFAGKNAKYPIELHSKFYAAAIVEDVWGAAIELGYKNTFLVQEGPQVLDDHIALNKAGIPTIDIIDFEYKHWHKLSDLPKECDPKTMAMVADVLIVYLQRLNVK